MAYNGSDKHKLKLWELFSKKQDTLTAGQNITLTPLQDGTVQIDASGGGGDVSDVQLDGTSILDEHGVANITTMQGATSQTAGTKGLVPAPTSSDKDKVLKGDGTWGEAGGGNVDDVKVNGTSVVDANKVAQIKSYKELTRAEYDLLPDTKYSDGILYCIKDSGSSKSNFFSNIVYSLQEREIGVWYNGKPVYGIVVVFSSSIIISNSEYTTTTIDSSDMEDIIYACAIHDDGTNSATLLADPTRDSHTKLGLQTGRNGNGVTCKALILQYTKMSDNPGTGKWGTNNVPLVHYDDTEQIIGSWFDDAIYSKVIDLEQDVSISYNSWTAITSVITTSWSRIISAFGLNDIGNYLPLCAAKDEGYLELKSTINSDKAVRYISIQYTKST